MEQLPVVHVRSRNQFSRWWPRGGEWEIKWIEGKGEEFEVLRKNLGVTGAWVCEPIGHTGGQGSFMGYDIEWPGQEIYDPLLDEPGLYLAFAALGQKVWSAYGRHIEFREEHKGGFPNELEQPILDFHRRFGPVLDDHRRLEIWGLDSVPQVLYKAQQIDLVVTYQQVITSELPISALRKRGSLIQYGSGTEARSDQELLRGVELFIDYEQFGSSGLGGIHLWAQPDASGQNSEDRAWIVIPRFGELINVIWYQAIRALVSGSITRICRNESCPRPGSLFKADRPNQFYCSPTCRSYQNTKAFRRRKRGGNGDMLEMSGGTKQ